MTHIVILDFRLWRIQMFSSISVNLRYWI